MDKKILIIDDLRIFNDLKPEDTWYARNSEEAINLILKNVFTETYWDYDLGGDDTSMKVLNFIDRTYHTEGWIPALGKSFVHTANPVGRQSLVLGLSRYYDTRQINIYNRDISSLELPN